MPSTMFHRVLSAALFAGALVSASPARADDVTIYRCVDAGGKVALQDRPCPKDVHQDVRQMVRPQDPPPHPGPIVVAEKTPPRAVEVRVVHDRNPPPTYRCTTPNGDTYLNHSGVPQGRYVPTWTYGFGSGLAHIGHPPRGAVQQPTGSRLHRGGAGFGFPVMSYVEDSCERLQQDEVCQDMRDRVDELGTLFFNGQPSDRERYDHERKGLEEQIRDECPDN